MRTIADLTVVCATDANHLRAVLRASVDHPGAMYIRLGRGRDPEVYAEVPDVAVRHGDPHPRGSRRSPSSPPARRSTRRWRPPTELAAAVGAEVAVYDMHTVKPLDLAAVAAAAAGPDGSSWSRSTTAPTASAPRSSRRSSTAGSARRARPPARRARRARPDRPSGRAVRALRPRRRRGGGRPDGAARRLSTPEADGLRPCGRRAGPSALPSGYPAPRNLIPPTGVQPAFRRTGNNRGRRPV